MNTVNQCLLTIFLCFMFPFYAFSNIQRQAPKDIDMPPCLYIYNGPGVSPISLLQMKESLKEVVDPSYVIKEIGPEEVIKGNWVKDAALYVMPGGADIPYCKSLSQNGNKVIKEYVNKGGSYLGVCAGAYYASDNIEFAKGTPLEVIGKRELSFFNGCAEGPVLAPYDYATNSGARLSFIRWRDKGDPDIKKDTMFPAYFNGGCHFVDAKKVPNVTPLAFYKEPNGKEDKAAIIDIKVGKGRALLSGVHFEYSPKLMDKDDPFLKKIQAELFLKDKERIRLFKGVLKRLKIKTI
ncbi:MAG: biotin--protein ligase [Proteobacteria bacterium]|nr:biotin--protein ligase [Pseudomonadota bacterium]